MVAAFPYRTVLSGDAASTRNMTTLQAVKDQAGITNNEHDSKILERIARASAAAVAYCGREFAKETLIDSFRTETEGRAVETLWLSRDPVSAITAVVEGGATLTSDDYELNEATGELWRLDGADNRTCWAHAKILVTFSGGYELVAELPRDLDQAVAELTTLGWFSQGQNPIVKAETVPGVLETQFWVGALPGNAAWPASITEILDRYRRVAV